MKRLRAFSLMEMMVVLLITAVVAAATAPMISRKMISSGGTDSPWVYTGNRRSIAYNLDGTPRTASIGGISPDDGPRLHIVSSDTNHPQIRLLSLSTNAASRAFVNISCWKQTVGITNKSVVNANDSVAIGIDADPFNSTTAVVIGEEAKSARGTYGTTAVGAMAKAEANGATALGSSANASATSATAIGSGAKAVANSVALGASANAASSDSVVIGHSSYLDGSSVTGSVVIGKGLRIAGANAVAIGRGSNASTQSTIAIGNTATSGGQDSIAIGTNSYTNGSSAINIGQNSGRNSTSNASGTNSIAIGRNAMAAATNSIAIGRNARVPLTSYYNSVAIGRNAAANKSNQITIGTSDDVVYIPGTLVTDKDVYLSAKSGLLHFRNSNGYGYIHHTWAADLNFAHNDGLPSGYTSSDRRLKNVGEVFKGGLAEIKKLEVFNYTFKKDPDKTPRVGIMAQDLQKIFPKAVFKGDDGFLRIRMEDMFYAMVNAIKELDIKIFNHDKKIEALEKQNAELEKHISALEKRLEKLEKSK